MIEHQQVKYNWQFTFLGADQDAFAEADAMGIAGAGVANLAKSKFQNAYGHTHEKIKRMRGAVLQGEEVDNAYTAAELRDWKAKIERDFVAANGLLQKCLEQS